VVLKICVVVERDNVLTGSDQPCSSQETETHFELPERGNQGLTYTFRLAAAL